MTSILDQYEKASKQMGTTAFINSLLENERPMFSKQKVAFTPQFPVRHMIAQSGKISLILVNNTLMRIDTQSPDKINELDLNKHISAGYKILKLFVDPTGHHLLISTMHKDREKDQEREDMNAELIYLNYNSNKPRPVAKIKGNLVTAVAWCVSNASQSTGPILLGTSRGLIYETELNQSGSEIYWKQVFDLGRGTAVAITGIEYFRLRAGGENQSVYGVLVTTMSKLYQFHGTLNTPGNRMEEKPFLLPLFHSYLNAKEKFIEIPSEFPLSRLRLYFNGEQPIQVAWMTGNGVLLAMISDKEGVMNPQHRMIPYPLPSDSQEDMETNRRRNLNYKYPLDIALTQFHLTMVFYDRMRIICTVNQQLVFEDSNDQTFGELRGLTWDGRTVRGRNPILWTFADYALFRYTVTDEARYMWQIYMDQKQFDLALQYCGDESSQRSQVLLQQAHHCLSKHQYEKAAKFYAQTDASFEEIALKFMEIKQEDALQTFLLEKASRLKGDQRMQLSMLVLWLLELMLRKLGSLKDAGVQVESPQYQVSWNALNRFTEQKRIMECIQSNLGAVYNLLSSHGLHDVLLHFASKLRDNQRIMEQHLLDRNYKEALQVLQSVSDRELLYSACPILLQQQPKEMVDVLILKAAHLELSRVTPLLFAALSDGDKRMALEIIRFVEHCVDNLNCKDRTIHTLLFSLYIRYQPDKTLPYLNGQGNDMKSVPYDAQSALRMCLAAETHQLQACVLLYRIMGQYQPAVEMALKIDAALARQTADMPEDNEELRKKLWLRIARHVVEKEKDIQRAMSVLQQCKLLKIEDVLPFFPDFTTIDLFKDAISQSLQEYSQHLETLKEEMEEATKAADALRQEIQAFRHKCIIVEAEDECQMCRFPLLSRSAYLFPCGHRFHGDCLLPRVLANMSKLRRERVQDLQRELASLPSNDNDSLSSSSLSVREQLLQDLDDILASDCIMCGEAVVRSIDAPFIPEDDLQAVEWD